MDVKKIYLLKVFLIMVIILLQGCKFDTLYEFAMYDHIRYDGHDYYISSKTVPDWTPLTVQVSLVDDNGKIDTKKTYNATRYTEDKECKYLFFDGAIYVKSKEVSVLQSVFLKQLTI
jgi:hypothetical protein